MEQGSGEHRCSSDPAVGDRGRARPLDTGVHRPFASLTNELMAERAGVQREQIDAWLRRLEVAAHRTSGRRRSGIPRRSRTRGRAAADLGRRRAAVATRSATTSRRSSSSSSSPAATPSTRERVPHGRSGGCRRLNSIRGGVGADGFEDGAGPSSCSRVRPPQTRTARRPGSAAQQRDSPRLRWGQRPVRTLARSSYSSPAARPGLHGLSMAPGALSR